MYRAFMYRFFAGRFWCLILFVVYFISCTRVENSMYIKYAEFHMSGYFLSEGYLQTMWLQM